MFYTFKKRQQPGPGALQYAFDSSLSLLPFSVIGAASPVFQPFMALQPPQLYANALTTTNPLTGGGQLAGQMVFQPLYDPSSQRSNGGL